MSAKERSRVFDGDQEGGQRNSVGEDGGGTLADGGPGLAYMPFVVMEDLLDKLKLLNYEEVKKAQKSYSLDKKSYLVHAYITINRMTLF